MSRIVSNLKVWMVDKLLFFEFFQKFLGEKWFGRWNNEYILAEKELSVVPLIIKSNSVIFDIGANRGEVSFFLATKCRGCKVFSFEPQERIFGVLKGASQKIGNIIPFKIAFSDSIGEKKLYIPIKNNFQYTQAASFDQMIDKKYKEEWVITETVDSFVKKNRIKKIDFIKCDTEGHELAIFSGSTKTLKSLRPIVFTEVKEKNRNKMLKMMEEMGYSAYRWDGEHMIPDNKNCRIKSENYYFLPNGK